ncbi:MAG: esterase family protein [Anaerolineaceae bacterium]|nr:esterase family protein [Anaerolineaceae bacterium]
MILLALVVVLAASLSACTSSTSTPTLSPTPPQATVQPTQTIRPTATATPVHVCTENKGRLEYGTLETDLLYRPLTFRVYLPPCYDTIRIEGYPVLYLLHGQGFTDDQWDRLGADEIADQFSTSGEYPPFIIVMPYEKYSLLDPYKSKYAEAVDEALVPWIDENYNTCIERKCRAVGGFSRGAAWAERIAFQYWKDFAYLGAHSLPLFREEISRLNRLVKQIPPNSFPQVYMDAGKKDQWRNSAREFLAFLVAHGVPHTYVDNEGKHEESYWQAHIEEYMRWYAEKLSQSELIP